MQMVCTNEHCFGIVPMHMFLNMHRNLIMVRILKFVPFLIKHRYHGKFLHLPRVYVLQHELVFSMLLLHRLALFMHNGLAVQPSPLELELRGALGRFQKLGHFFRAFVDFLVACVAYIDKICLVIFME